MTDAPSPCDCAGPGAPRPEARAYFEAEEAARGGTWAPMLRRCTGCDLVYLAAPDAPLGGGYGFRSSVMSIVSLLTRFRARWLASLARKGARAIDVGAGVGTLVGEMRRIGLDAIGIEPALERREQAEGEVYPGTIADGALAAPPFDAAPFDLAVFWHTLEHHPEPAADLARMTDALAPGARVVVAVPNVGSWQARMAGSRWLHLDLPHHRTHFTPDTLRATAERAGLEVERLWTGHIEMDVAGWIDTLSLVVGLPPRFCFNALRGEAVPGGPLGRLFAFVLVLVLAPIALGLSILARLVGSAGTVRMVARKPGGSA